MQLYVECQLHFQPPPPALVDTHYPSHSYTHWLLLAFLISRLVYIEFTLCTYYVVVPMLKVRNGHIKRITDGDIQSLVLELMGTNVWYFNILSFC